MRSDFSHSQATEFQINYLKENSINAKCYQKKFRSSMQGSFALIHTYNIDICITYLYIYIYNACMCCVYTYIYMPLRKHHSSRKQKLFCFFKVPRNGSKEEKLVFKTLICSPYFPQFPQPYACSWLPRDAYGQSGKHPAQWNALLLFYSRQTDRHTVPHMQPEMLS